MDMNRGEITNEHWERLQGLLPAQKPKTGRTNLDHRMVLNGILWILRTGAPWRDLPERYGKWKTVASRFYRWQKAGIWERVFAAVQQQGDAQGELDWDVHFVDGTVVRAHQHAAGAKKGIQKQKRSDAAEAASAPKYICALRATASR